MDTTQIALANLIGFTVESADGRVGEVAEETRELAPQRFAVSTGGWLTRTTVVLPVDVVQRVDLELEKVVVTPTKDAIENAPEWDESNADLPAELEAYFGAPPRA